MASIKYVAKVIQPEGKLVYEYNPLYNYRKEANDGMITDLITKNSDTYGDQLNFSLTNPIDIQCQESYDGSVNLPSFPPIALLQLSLFSSAPLRLVLFTYIEL